MCGIVGFAGSNGSLSELEQAVNSLTHRGPDFRSTWQKEMVMLGHSRLSIIDLSAEANQPMCSVNKRYTVVFNGEIYNFKELIARHQLLMQTHSDTEVILQLFEKLGADMVLEFNGMFAMAIYDQVTDELWLFRDRLGKKPLFYFVQGDTLVFASEIKALFEFSLVKKQSGMDASSIGQFLQLGYIAEPHTFFKSIFKFPAASYAVWQSGKLQIKSYWSVEKSLSPRTENNYSKALTDLDRLLNDSVEKRLISDVPLGIFLSGGVDSSIIAAMAQRQSNQAINTFSIGFPNKKYDESIHAQNVAKAIGTQHHQFMVTEADIIDQFESFFDMFDEPFSDSSGFPTAMVSQLAKSKVSVSLTGDGGDELFHGYGMYLWANRLQNPLVNLLRKPSALVLEQLSPPYKRVAGLLDYPNQSHFKSHVFSQEQYFFSLKELKNLSGNNSIQGSLDEGVVSPRHLTASEQQAIFDIKYYLRDDLLVKADRASMKWSLELRSPFLDYRLVEWAINLNPDFKIQGRNQKVILKDLLHQYVDAKWFQRPKWGFSMPLDSWLKNELKPVLEYYTSETMLKRYGLVDYKVVAKLKQKYFSGETYLYNRLWLILVLHKNLEKYQSKGLKLV